MNWKAIVSVACLVAVGNVMAINEAPSKVSGDYLEVRSCDVYTGPCFANGEMGLNGKEAIMVWKIREGAWNGAQLDGLSVIAVVGTEKTIGDVRYNPRNGEAMIITDASASESQKKALADFARSKAQRVASKIVSVESAEIAASLNEPSKPGCASVKAGELVNISTRCLTEEDDLCGNERIFYPPMSSTVDNINPAFTEVAAFEGTALNRTWESIRTRGAFLASFDQ